jgi:hypothetical protein
MEILFPSEFEMAYNKLHRRPAFVGGTSSGRYIPFDDVKHRKDAQKEEHKAALNRSLITKRKGFTGGDISSPEALKLIPSLLKRRAEDYRKISAAAAHIPTSAEVLPTVALSSSVEVSQRLDSLLNLIIASLSAGFFSNESLKSAYEALNLLLQDGYLLNTNQLKYFNHSLAIVYDTLKISARDEANSGDQYIYRAISLVIDVFGKSLRSIISKSNLGRKQRELFQKSVRTSASRYLKEKTKLGLKGRQRRLTPEEEERAFDLAFIRRGALPQL